MTFLHNSLFSYSVFSSHPRASSPTVGSLGYDEAVEAVGKEISRIRITINNLSRQIVSQNSKLKLVDEKQDMLAKQKAILIKLSKLSHTQNTKLVLEEHELVRLERCYTQLKDIHTFRISTDITKKIFHDIPITPTKGGVVKVPQGSGSRCETRTTTTGES